MNNHLEVCKLLLEHHASLETPDELKCTPIHMACKKGSLDCVKLLLHMNARYDARDFRDWTPLHYASYNGHPKVINKLCIWDADEDKLRHIRNKQNKLALNLAKDQATKDAFKRK